MTDQRTIGEIEDVLGSIRRLVSEDAAARPGGSAGRLVLTPALRVDPAPEETSDAEDDGGEGRDDDPDPALQAVPDGTPKVTAEAEPATGETAGAEAVPEAPFVEAVQDDEAPGEAAPDAPEDEAPRIEAAVAGEGEPAPTAEPQADPAADAEATPVDLARELAELEARVAETAGHWAAETLADRISVPVEEYDEWEPADEPIGVPFRARAAEAAETPAAEEPPIEAEVVRFSHAAAAPDEAPDETPDNVARPDAEALLDEKELRALVAEVLREELKGPLGERITRNVRKLVRREIAQALSNLDTD
jgi:hypothetical protein